MQCLQCQTHWPDELAGAMKFCGACGAPMSATPIVSPPADTPPGGELRYVTILFADLAGFTAFAEDRPPDEVARIMDDLMHTLRDSVERYGGQVEKFFGDAIMAVFGMPRADPAASRTAVRTGLAFQSAMEQFRQDHQLSFQLRVGIHVGEVMFREVGGAWTVLGDTVNTASRIQSVATLGKVWISRPVYEDVRRHFTLISRPAVELKGKKQSVQPYEVVDERSTPFMELPRFVGRETEWAQIQAVLADAINQRTLRVLVVSGPAGIGKSRLVWELRDWVQRQETVYRINVIQYDHSERLPAHGLNALLRSRFDLPLNLDEETTLQYLLERMPQQNPFVEAERAALIPEFFAFVLGLLRDSFHIASMDGKGKWDGAYVEIKRWLEGWATRRPWLIFFEDVQKGDAETAAFVEWALHLPWTAPVLFVVTARDEDFTPECHWHGPVTRWLREGLATELRMRELLPEVLAPALVVMTEGALSESLARYIAEHTEGNPLFATEVVLLLKEQGLLTDDAHPEKMLLPGTIREVMEARLERLGMEGKEVVKRGALMGRRFTREAVERIWQQTLTELDLGFHILLETETIYEEASKLLAGEIESVFRHGRLQEAALARIPRQEKLKWLEGLELWARTKLEIMGVHWEVAGVMLIPLVARSLEERGETREAILWYEGLGWLHRKQNRSAEAVEAFRHAFNLAPGGVRRFILGRLIADEQDFVGEFEKSLQTIDEAVAPLAGSNEPDTGFDRPQARFAALITDPLARAETLSLEAAQLALELTRANALTHLARVAEAQTVYQFIRARLTAGAVPGEIGQRLWLRWCRAWVYLLNEITGQSTEAEQVLQEVYAQVDLSAPALADERLALLHAEATVAYGQGRYDRMQALSEERLHLAQRYGDRRSEANALNMLGIVHHQYGEIRVAQQIYEQAIQVMRTIGDRRGEALSLHNLGLVSFSLGEWEASLRCQEQYLSLSRSIGNHLAEAYSPLATSAVLVAQGDFEQAKSKLGQARQVAEVNHWSRLDQIIRTALAYTNVLECLSAPAQDTLLRAIADFVSTEASWKDSDDVGEYYAVLAVAWCAAGEPAEAQAVLTRAEGSLQESWRHVQAWLDLARALINDQSLTPALTWFQEHDQRWALTQAERLKQALQAF